MPRDEAGEGPAIVGIRHETNRGRGAAVKTGYRAALNDGIDIVAVLDGDGQMDPEMLDSFVDPIVEAEADYAKGNRLETPETRAEMSNWRLFGNTVLTGLTRVASGYWGMTDPQNGYTAISRDALKRLEFDSLYDGYGFLNDVLVRLNAQDVKIVDIPMRALYGDEESGIQYSSFVPVLSLLLLRRFVWRIGTKYDLSAFHPVAVLYGLAAAVGLGGIAYGVHAVAVADGPLRIPIAAVSVLACLFFVGVAFVTERHYNRDLELDVGADRPLGNR